jgi:3,4-dihydroxy 2-butanone 4-phosphate synthase/GTP cyclohydrolase II
MHALSLFADAFGERDSRTGLMQGAMKIIGEEGSGVIVVINRTLPDAISKAVNIRSGRAEAPDMEALRDYGIGAQILAALGVHDMVLLTNSHHTPVALGGYGLKIVGERPIPVEE